MGLEDRLKRLEVKAPTNSEWVIPMEVRILTKAVARHHARNDGRRLPPYTQEEVEHLREEDLEIVAGGGVVGQYRESGGWQDEKGRELLDGWERDAHGRLEAAKDLPPERWHEVWGNDDKDEQIEEYEFE